MNWRRKTCSTFILCFKINNRSKPKQTEANDYHYYPKEHSFGSVVSSLGKPSTLRFLPRAEGHKECSHFLLSPPCPSGASPSSAQESEISLHCRIANSISLSTLITCQTLAFFQFWPVLFLSQILHSPLECSVTIAIGIDLSLLLSCETVVQ